MKQGEKYRQSVSLLKVKFQYCDEEFFLYQFLYVGIVVILYGVWTTEQFVTLFCMYL